MPPGRGRETEDGKHRGGAYVSSPNTRGDRQAAGADRRATRGPVPVSSSNAAPHPSRSPAIIQGGMGVGVSSWRLARAVARTGQLGVVSGVALDTLLARRLQTGDDGGHVRHALA